jgi:hypothetical protein
MLLTYYSAVLILGRAMWIGQFAQLSAHIAIIPTSQK